MEAEASETMQAGANRYSSDKACRQFRLSDKEYMQLSGKACKLLKSLTYKYRLLNPTIGRTGKMDTEYKWLYRFADSC